MLAGGVAPWVTILALLLLCGCAKVTGTCPRGVTGPCTFRVESFLRRVDTVATHQGVCVAVKGVSANATAGGIAVGGLLAGPAGAAAGGAFGLASDVIQRGDPEPSICRPLRLEER